MNPAASKETGRVLRAGVRKLDHVRSLLGPVQFPDDPTRSRRARLLHRSLVWLGILGAGVLIGGLVGAVPLAMHTIVLTFLVFLPILQGIAVYHRLETAELGLLLLLYFGITSCLIVLGTIRIPGAGLYLLVGMLAGLFFGKRAAWVWSGVCILTLLGLAVAESRGLLPERFVTRPAMQLVIITSLLASTTGLFSWVIDWQRDTLREAEDQIAERKRAEACLAAKTRELEEAISEIKTLSGVVPVCAWCRKVRDDEQYTQSLESFVEQHTHAKFTHGICPECRQKAFPQLSKET